jgi:hypothetical protein
MHMKEKLNTSVHVPFNGAIMIIIAFFFFGSCMENEIEAPEISSGDLTLLNDNSHGHGGAISMNHKRTFTANLTGSQEVPEVTTDGSGQAIFKLSKDGTSISYKLIVNNLEGVTQAHIHCGEAGANGPVVVFLFGFVTGGVASNGVLAEGTITAASIIARPDSEACMGGVANLEELISKMRNGGAYVNVHTVVNPPGEIRGQIR